MRTAEKERLVKKYNAIAGEVENTLQNLSYDNDSPIELLDEDEDEDIVIEAIDDLENALYYLGGDILLEIEELTECHRRIEELRTGKKMEKLNELYSQYV